MTTHLSRFFRQRRLDRQIGLGEAASQCDYKNIAKGGNRIKQFEDSGQIHSDLLQKLAAVLDISADDICRAIADDRAEWERWADEPTEPYLIIRLVAAFYSDKSIPADLHGDAEAMKRFASSFAKSKRMRVCLVLSRRLRVWFDAEGNVEDETVDTFETSYAPFMHVGGRKFLLSILESESNRRSS